MKRPTLSMLARPTLSPRNRRALTLGALLIAPSLLWKGVVAPYLGTASELAQRLDTERQLLDGELRLLAAAPRYPAATREGAARFMRTSVRLFSGLDDGQADAAFVGYVQAVAADEDVLLTRVEPLPAAAGVAGVIPISLDVRGRTDLDGLLAVLRSLEQGPKAVRVDSLQVTLLGASRSGGAFAESAADAWPAEEASEEDARPQALDFHFTVTGLALPDSLIRAAAPAPSRPSHP